jgi:membrane protein DedA with SNARE-associated domain
VILAAFRGSLCGDQLFFHLGRKHSQPVLSRRPAWKEKSAKIHKMMNRFETPMIVSFRFLYGLRTVAPFVIGMSPVSFKKFILLDAAWNLTVGLLITGIVAFLVKGSDYEEATALLFILVALWPTRRHF